METLFWGSFFLIFYAYLGYPIFLTTVSIFRNCPVIKGPVTPSVSFIITAYNEEKRIAKKIENTLRQDYPKEKLEIIVTSDGSSDQTDSIVMTYASRGVRLVRAEGRGGKEGAQGLAVASASGEILVFSDVATMLDRHAVSTIVQNFYDPTVGCVSSVDRFVDVDGKVSGEGTYVRYEMFLRRLEGKVNTLVGLSGSFFAARLEVCQPWSVDLQSDFNTLLNAVKKGFRGVSDPHCIGYYPNILDESKEYDRKVRTVLRGITVFMKSLSLVNPFRFGFFAWQLFSHKLCRWCVPFALVGAFLSNFALMFHSIGYGFLFFGQCIFYLFAFWGLNMKGRSNQPFLTIPSFFVLVNLSILNAWLRYVRGDQILSWTPSER